MQGGDACVALSTQCWVDAGRGRKRRPRCHAHDSLASRSIGGRKRPYGAARLFSSNPLDLIRKRQYKPEDRTFSLMAGEAHAAVVLLDDGSGDVQAKPQAAA